MVGLLESLKKLVEWQQVVAAARKVPELERRIAVLETRLGSTTQLPTCPSCAIGRWRKIKSAPNKTFGDMGGLDVTFGCDACSYTETKIET
ncbi:MAG: hypothetical protein E6Q78_05180 [Rhodoferax sp.]|nr:MAG: hypothetical protein E6Q78_05180 [Rhodoferax sp.]